MLTDYCTVLVTEEDPTLWPRLHEADRLGIDIETTGLDPHVDSIQSIQIAIKGTVYILDCRKGAFTGFADFLDDFAGEIIFHNAKFDLKFLYKNYNVIPRHVRDTFLAEKLLITGRYAEPRSASLKAVAERYLGIEMDKAVRLTYLQEELQLEDFTQEQIEYSALDAFVLFAIHDIQVKALEETGQSRVYDLECQFVPVLVQAELKGIGLDREAWTLLYKAAQLEAASLLLRLQEAAGTEFNPNSPKQLITVFKSLKIPVPVFQGKETTKEEHIAKIRHPFVEMLLAYRQQAKLASTYGEDFLNNIHPVTSRVHATFHQLGTETGRLSSAQPNLQNIPHSQEIRACFKAAPGYKIISADFSMQEIVIQAELSRDSELVRILNEGIDRHRATASILFEVDYDAVTSEQRAKGKMFNFGVGYGSSAWNMANKLELPERFVEKALDTYWKTFDTLRKFNMRTGLIAYRDGYSSTALGRRRWYVNLDKQKVMRLAANHVIQGTAADMTKQAAILISNFIHENQLDATIVNFVHDELEVEVVEEEAEALAEMVKVLMERAGSMSVSVVKQGAEVKLGDAWTK